MGNTGPQSGHNTIPVNATNYDPGAECTGDLNGDGALTIQDLLIILGDFGCTSSCEGDVDGDGAVTIYDALSFLSLFGTTC